MSVNIGKIEEAIENTGTGPAAQQRKQQLERQLATATATYQKLCGGKQELNPPLAGGGRA